MSDPNEEHLRPRLLKEIPSQTEQEILETLQELRILFPSYRDDQLLIFWLGKLKQTGVEITNFSSAVSFQDRPANH